MSQSPVAESSTTGRDILTVSATKTVQIRVHDHRSLALIRPQWDAYVGRRGRVPLSYHPAWLKVLEQGLKHVPYLIEAVEEEKTVGLLPLAFVKSRMFGRFLVGLPYLNYGGVIADDELVSRKLIDKAIELAEKLDVRHLELRHKRAIEHPRLTTRTGHKVHMIRELPATPEVLMKQLQSNVRNHIRKGQKNGLMVAWGGEELLPEFYDVFSQNMRDLGTPVYSSRLFRAALRQFPDRVELCVVRLRPKPLRPASWSTVGKQPKSPARARCALQFHQRQFVDVLESTRARDRARPGNVRFRPFDTGNIGLLLQGTVGCEARAGRVAVLLACWK